MLFTLTWKNLVTHVLSLDLTKIYNIGFLLSFSWVVQILSGVFLALSFRVCHDGFLFVLTQIDSEVLFWSRSIHVSGTSAIYFFLYIHLFKALMYDIVSNSSPLISSIGLLVFILAVIIAFLGYVLPLSQMSYWGLIVFSNLIATIPIVGKTVLYWLWGGEWISTETLSKIHALHVILPIISLGVILFHLLILHINTSSCGFFDRFTTSYEVCFFYWFIIL